MTPTGTRIVFYGFGAFVGRLRGETLCDWWHDDPASLKWDLGLLVPTDLAKTPSAAIAGAIHPDEIECDDHRSDGGLTQIGPRFPQGGMMGSIWLSETYYKRLGAKAPPRPVPNDGHEYEYTSIVYLDGTKKPRRYLGFHARAKGTQGSLTEVELFYRGRSKVPGERPLGNYWLDLAQVAHDPDPVATQVAAGGPQEGALFLEDTVVHTFSGGGSGPKIPRTAGFD